MLGFVKVILGWHECIFLIFFGFLRYMLMASQRRVEWESATHICNRIVSMVILNKSTTDNVSWFAVFEAVVDEIREKSRNFVIWISQKFDDCFSGFFSKAQRSLCRSGFASIPSKIDLCRPCIPSDMIKFRHVDLLQWARICLSFEVNIPLYRAGGIWTSQNPVLYTTVRASYRQNVNNFPRGRERFFDRLSCL